MRLKKTDLVILPCTSGKEGRRTKWPEKRLRDFLGPQAAKILRAGRKDAFNHPKTRFSQRCPSTRRHRVGRY